jgi:hypothetical protein
MAVYWTYITDSTTGMCHRKTNIHNIYTRVYKYGDFVPLLPRGKKASCRPIRLFDTSNIRRTSTFHDDQSILDLRRLGTLQKEIKSLWSWLYQRFSTCNWRSYFNFFTCVVWLGTNSINHGPLRNLKEAELVKNFTACTGTRLSQPCSKYMQFTQSCTVS